MRPVRANCFAQPAHRAAMLGHLVALALVAGLFVHLWPLDAQVQASSGFGGATNATSGGQVEFVDSYPYYIQSPIVNQQQQQQSQRSQEVPMIKQQRSNIPLGPEAGTSSSSQTGGSDAGVPSAGASSARHVPVMLNQNQAPPPPQNLMMVAHPQVPLPQSQQCLYDKRYFLQLDQCLERKPYPTVGLPAFKNEDLLIKKGLSDKYGCSFILTNGLFKSYQISKYSLDSDTQCLDRDKTSQVSIQFSNVTLYYLWQLRCLNYADQLLDDATLGGRTLIQPSDLNGQTLSGGGGGGGGASGGGGGHAHKSSGICVGSSQNFGFTSLQMANVEAQVDLSIDIYKNWRVTNVTLALGGSGGGAHLSKHQEHDYGHEAQAHNGGGANTAAHVDRAGGIRDFTFESLDGDELNWRYLHLYENWTRNRLHVNFHDQFKRFLWVSLQRCLSESSEKLPVKLVDMFGHHKYN